MKEHFDMKWGQHLTMRITGDVPEHPALAPRLESMQKGLMAGFDGGIANSKATKGAEREVFVGGLLRQVFPPTFRFGTGDITDFAGERSGQVDIAIEFPHIFSLPLAPDGPRLYMAESVAAVIEVKSNVAKHWGLVCKSAAKVKALRRRFYHHYLSEEANRSDRFVEAMSIHGKSADESNAHFRARAAAHRAELEQLSRSVPDRIPFFAVGFDGWSDIESARKATELASIDGVMVIRDMVYVSQRYQAHGPMALLVFLDHIYEELSKPVQTLPAYDNYAFKHYEATSFPNPDTSIQGFIAGNKPTS